MKGWDPAPSLRVFRMLEFVLHRIYYGELFGLI